MANTKAASLADALVEQFQERIRSGAMPAGARMPTEKEIANSAAVSRTVVREAFARLSAMGLIASRQGSGAFVAESARYGAFQITPDEVREVDDVIKLLELRIAVETEMAGLAASRRSSADLTAIRGWLQRMTDSTDPEESAEADAAFHTAIASATGNEYYSRFMAFLGVRLVPSRTLYLRDQSSDAHRAYALDIANDHQAIVDAIAAQDVAGARRAANTHLARSLERHSRLRDDRAAGIAATGAAASCAITAHASPTSSSNHNANLSYK